MDMGDVSFSATTSLAAISETTNQEKLYGSGIFFKQEFLSGGTTTTNTEGDLRGLKVAKTVAFDDFSAPKAMHKSSLLRSNSNNFDSSHGSQMLCFSSPNSSQSVTFPFYHSSSNAYAKNAAYGGGMQGTKGSFTPSQWMELEHQALIYKYIHANVPIPSSLLIPIRKALDSAGFSGFMGLRPSTYGWGAYQLGYSSSTDPEPGRCRRTDGKKWRCAKDAMSDHKYCERHMNRGRHRSRKHVERQSGNSVTGTMKTSTTKQMPPMPMASSMSAAVVAAGDSETNSLGLGTNQSLYNAPSALAAPCSASGSGNRNILDKVSFSGKYQDIDGLSMISPSLNFKENQCSILKPQNASHESSGGEFGQVSFDSLLNPFNKSYGASSEECIDDIKSNKPQNGLHQFFTDWPNNDSQSKSSWQDINMNSERTQLSISIPSTISDFMSSTSSPTNKHSPNLETSTQMDKSSREASWIPVNWESSSIGGPLAEVLNNTNNNNNNINNSVDSGAPSLNLMTGGGWDGSPYMASSPTGVLQKAAFLSSSNSSAGSSPRAAADISKAYIGGVNNLCSNVFVSSHTNPVLPNL